MPTRSLDIAVDVVWGYTYTHLPSRAEQKQTMEAAKWPDLAKFLHCGKVFQVFGQYLAWFFSIWQNVVPTFDKF